VLLQLGAIIAVCVIVACHGDGPSRKQPIGSGANEVKAGTPADALRLAIRDGDIDRVRSAIAAGADPNGSGEAYRVLGLAILESDTAVVRELIKAGADPNARTLDETALPMLHLAVSVRNRKLVEALLAAGADPDARSERHGLTAIAAAALSDASTVCPPLVRAGADVNGRVVWPIDDPGPGASGAGKTGGRTPLMLAARLGHARTVGVLLSLGADATLKDERGQTAADMIGTEQNPLEIIRRHLSNATAARAPNVR